MGPYSTSGESLSLLECCRAKCDNEPRESVYYEDVHGQQYAEVDACAQHIDSLRKYIPGFTAENPILCVVKGCENKRRAIGCCDNHSKHVKKWGLQELAKEYAAHSCLAALNSVNIQPTLEPVVIAEPTTTETQQEEPTMPTSTCADVAQASPVDVECDDGNPLIEAWQKAKLVPMEVMDERLAEILRLEQENTALREQLAKVEKQTSVFMLDESDLRGRYSDLVQGQQTIRELREGAYLTVKLNNSEVRMDESDIERIKAGILRRAEALIDGALRLNVTVEPKDALFYLVWSPDGRTPPRYKHYSLEEAKKTANQMKSIHGGEFYAVAVIGDVSDKKDDIPF